MKNLIAFGLLSVGMFVSMFQIHLSGVPNEYAKNMFMFGTLWPPVLYLMGISSIHYRNQFPETAPEGLADYLLKPITIVLVLIVAIFWTFFEIWTISNLSAAILCVIPSLMSILFWPWKEEKLL